MSKDDMRAAIARWVAIEDEARALVTAADLVLTECSLPNRQRSSLSDRADTLSAALNVEEPNTAWMRAFPPSGPAAVAVEEVERHLAVLDRVNSLLGDAWLPRADLIQQFDAAVGFFRRLASPQDHGAVRDAALEEAAVWHDSQIQGGHCGEASDEMMVRQRVERHHSRSAEGIRALKTYTDKPGREGEEVPSSRDRRVDGLVRPDWHGKSDTHGLAFWNARIGKWQGGVPEPLATQSDAPQQDGEHGVGR